MADVDSGRIVLDSSKNYQKILIESSQAVSVADPDFRQQITVTHSLGYHPAVRVWFLNASGHMCEATGQVVFTVYGSVTSDFDAHSCYYYIYDDRVEIFFDRGATSGPTSTSTVYWRVYADAA